MEVISIKSHRYGKLRCPVGRVYEATYKDALVLGMMGWVEPHNPKPKTPVAIQESEPPKPKKRGRKRRETGAEE